MAYCLGLVAAVVVVVVVVEQAWLVPVPFAAAVVAVSIPRIVPPVGFVGAAAEQAFYSVHSYLRSFDLSVVVSSNFIHLIFFYFKL